MNEAPPFESRLLDSGILAIALRGNLDTTSARVFEEEVQQHLDALFTKIIIDCRHLGFISSLGIGALVKLQTQLRRKGGEVKLAAVQGPVMNLLRLVRLDRYFDYYNDLESARRSFAPRESN